MLRRFVFVLSLSLLIDLLYMPLYADKSRILGEVTGIDNEGNVEYLRLTAPKILLSKKEIYHYEILKVTLDGIDGLDPDLFYMEVSHNGAGCLSFGMTYKIPFLERNSVMQAVYLPAWNEGEGELEINFFYAGRKIRTDAPVKFELKRRPVLPPEKMFSIVDLEMNKSVADKSFIDSCSRRTDYTAVLDWARFMRADMLWILAGETTSFKTNRKIGSAWWDEGPLENLRLLKEAARGTSVKIGAYVMSFYVPGGTGVTKRYNPGIGYNSVQDYLYRSRHISLGCEKRIEDIIKLVRSFQNDPDVHYIGFDFIRTGRADGYELAGEVVDDTNIRTPLEWDLYSASEKIRWFARKIEVEKDPVVIEKWRWWRAHRVALIVKRIIEEADVTKPVWVYTLGWDHGKEHGQDPVMFFDAGVSIDAVMLYEANRDQFVRLLGQWNRYFTHGQGNIVIGNCVDATLLDGDLNPPDELFRRNSEGYSGIMRNGFASGIFFHDIARALWGRKGGYTFRDYAVAFMSSVYSLRRDAMEPELLIDVRLDDVVSQTGSVQGELRIRNNSTTGIGSIHVELLTGQMGEAKKNIIRYALESAGNDPRTFLINNISTFELLRIPFTLEKTDSNTTSIRFRVAAGENRVYYITKLLMSDKNAQVLSKNR